MAFGQPAGPPASFRQLEELTTLLHEAGHADFRDARGPMGFTQRQSGGKFTRDEAAAFIERLQDDASDSSGPPAPTPTLPSRPGRSRPPVRTPRTSATVVGIGDVPSERLAEELERRGWVVTGPAEP
jgi:hypothetical protein